MLAHSSGRPGVQAVSQAGLTLYKLPGASRLHTQPQSLPCSWQPELQELGIWAAHGRGGRPGWAGFGSICLQRLSGLLTVRWDGMGAYAGPWLSQDLLNRMIAYSLVSRVTVGGWGGGFRRKPWRGKTYSGQQPETRTHHTTQAWQAGLISTPSLHGFLPQHGCSRQRWMSR